MGEPTTSVKDFIFHRDADGELTGATMKEFKELTSDAKNTVTIQYHPDVTKKELLQILESMTALARADYQKAIENGGLAGTGGLL